MKNRASAFEFGAKIGSAAVYKSPKAASSIIHYKFFTTQGTDFTLENFFR